MKDFISFMEKAWLRYITEGILEEGIREEVKDSWKLCREYGVDPFGGVGEILDEKSMKIRLKENEELITVAHPIMEDIYRQVTGSGFLLVLVDKDGYLIDRIGDENIMGETRKLNFVEGALWTEEAVGTNAIALALRLDRPIQLVGAEHYCITHHMATCSAAPIHDEEGNVIGCLDMTGLKEDAHPHNLGVVLAGAYSIEKQLALIRSHKLIDATFDSIHEGMLILDHHFIVQRVNEIALRILNITPQEIIGRHIQSFVDFDIIKEVLNQSEPYYDVEGAFYSRGRKIPCRINAVPVMANRKTIGTVITFREERYVRNVVNKLAGFRAYYTFEDIVTQDDKMKKVIETAKKAAKSDCSILIEGESGTGKELFAQAIHNYSKRAKGPFVAVNCASIPRELVESELFGYEKGAFTGANKEGKPGKFELADNGTIFLDEIGELPYEVQSKLLRVLDNHKIVRVGGTEEKKLNVRVIAATNRSLSEEVEKKNFRNDLYYRINVIKINIPPLRERKGDIELLAKVFVDRLNKYNNEQKVLSESFIKRLKDYHWPGNVRELQNVINRAYYLAEGEIITEDYFPEKIERKNYEEDINVTAVLPFDVIEEKNIKEALRLAKGDVVKAAKMLNLSRATIYRKIKKYKVNLKELSSLVEKK
ncbi:sigma-54-dependent Fis family transcriptional regulator [Caldanaerobacter subterraneus]|uniref:Sigma-54-dependent Fis family transcriptional regulator n=1 Tax=Caldanaerobacter subterraneus TaxID=911092 RepID=A0A7Y2L5L3_9THEO|nr:sigma-54-dependent Fis family transcriptional regulator [Caldanaerobacter subterraneus]NNG66035.1 sigma-54-dependent Fis family transcriptional regulator [Caldanaerobacter subterraneus]